MISYFIFIFHLLRFYIYQVAETKLNKNSSRSHCVFTITVHTTETKVIEHQNESEPGIATDGW